MKRFTIRSAALLTSTMAIALLSSVAPSYAFTPFNFTTNYSQSGSGSFDPTQDIGLDSVMFGSHTVSSFTYASSLESFGNNDTTTTLEDSSLGPFSSDRGDNASGINVENPTDANLLTSLANNNLNNIIDGEDAAAGAGMDIFFNQPTNHLFFFERGGNSDLTVTLINLINGNLSLGASYILGRGDFQDAGFSINTTEIVGAQRVVSRGLRHSQNIFGVRLTAHAGSNGPDFKVVGANVRDVPTPSMFLGLGLMAWKTLKRRSIEASKSV
jgi:hypothetical protein